MDTIRVQIGDESIEIRRLNHYDKEVFIRSLLREVLPKTVDVRELSRSTCLEIFNKLWYESDS